MTAAANRQDTGAAVAGLFARPSATGGLAGRNDAAAAADDGASQQRAAAPEPRVRLGVELTESQIASLRGLSRPARTGGARTLGAKFVAAGVLAAAIELLEHAAIDMHGIAAGDLSEMTARARDALERAGATHHDATKETR
jgi:hypothetical protein